MYVYSQYARVYVCIEYMHLYAYVCIEYVSANQLVYYIHVAYYLELPRQLRMGRVILAIEKTRLRIVRSYLKGH